MRREGKKRGEKVVEKNGVNLVLIPIAWCKKAVREVLVAQGQAVKAAKTERCLSYIASTLKLAKRTFEER